MYIHKRGENQACFSLTDKAGLLFLQCCLSTDTNYAVLYPGLLYSLCVKLDLIDIYWTKYDSHRLRILLSALLVTVFTFLFMFLTIY